MYKRQNLLRIRGARRSARRQGGLRQQERNRRRSGHRTENLTAAQNALAEKPKPATVESIKVAAKPAKTEYTVGDTFSADGLKVVKVMSDKTEPGKKPGAQKPAGQQNVCPRPVPRWLAWPVRSRCCSPPVWP